MTRIVFLGIVVLGLILGVKLEYMPAAILAALGLAAVYIRIKTRRERKVAEREQKND